MKGETDILEKTEMDALRSVALFRYVRDRIAILSRIILTTKSGARNKGVGVEVNNNLTANRVIDYRAAPGVCRSTDDAAAVDV